MVSITIIIINTQCHIIFLEPQPIARVICQGDTWEGQPEIGFWCYQKPDNAEPQGKDGEAVPKGNILFAYLWSGFILVSDYTI